MKNWVKIILALSIVAAVALVYILSQSSDVNNIEVEFRGESFKSPGAVFLGDQGIDLLIANAASDPKIAQWLTGYFAQAANRASEAPKPKQTIAHEGDLSVIDAGLIYDQFNLLVAYALDARLNGNQDSLAQAERFLIDWAQTYKPGGDPISEELFIIYVAAYELVRDDVSAGVQTQVDGFLTSLFSAGREFVKSQADVKFAANNHWVSRHVMLLTAIAFLSGNDDAIDYAIEAYQSQLSQNLILASTFRQRLPNVEPPEELGFLAFEDRDYALTSDFIQRDALLYHIISLQALDTARLIAANNGQDWVKLTGRDGQRLEDAYLFLLPFAQGELAQVEFVNSRQSSDRGRQYNFNPSDAAVALSLAAVTSDEYKPYMRLGNLFESNTFLYIIFANYQFGS